MTPPVNVRGDRRRQAEVAVDPGSHRRTVLQQEEEAERSEGEGEHERCDSGDAVDDPPREGGDDLGSHLLDARLHVRAFGLVDARVLQPPFRLVRGGGRVLRDLRLLRTDSAHDDEHHEDADEDEAEQHDGGCRRTRHVPREPPDERHGDRRDDRRGDDRADDRVGRPEEPDHPAQQQEEPDERPGCAADVEQPARRGEKSLQLSQLDRVDLSGRGLGQVPLAVPMSA